MPQATQSALRAVFAGIGRILSVTDKVRNKQAAEAPASSPGTETAAAPETVAAEAVAPEPAAPETVAPEPAEPEGAAQPETVVPQAEAKVAESEKAGTGTMKPEATAEPGAGADLPLPNYEQLTIASVRARLRNLSVAQLRTLIEHEKAHAARQDFISMFERRITKVESEK